MSKLLRLKKQMINAFILIFLFSFMTPGSLVLGATEAKSYVALGDSISFGMSAVPGKGYVDQFHTYLKGLEMYKDIQLTNLSTPGDASTNLKSKIALNQEVIKNADVITISIGGNNLLGPVIASMAKLFNINPVNNPNFQLELATAIASDPLAHQKIMAMSQEPAFTAALTAGVTTFGADWNEIVLSIRAMAPQAEIYVNTIYNPFNALDPFYGMFDTLINQINAIINMGTPYYKVVGVNGEFKKDHGQPLVNFNIAAGAIDPHPNTLGHGVIYEALKALVVIPEPKPDFTVSSTFNLTALQPNKLLCVDAAVTNNLNSEQPVIAIVALFDGSNRMISLAYISKNIGAGVTENLSAGFYLPANITNHKVKVFVWKGTSLTNTNMQPISNVVTLQ
jgi:lysophospholipase L1-like esterase